MAPDAILPNGEGLKAPLGCLTQARYGIAWGAMGAAMACYDEALEYSKVRIMFGKPIGAFQLVQAQARRHGDRDHQGAAARAPARPAQGEEADTPEQVSLAKRNNCEIALDIAREARDILGANGITGEYPVMRHMCNLESVNTYEGTHNIHTLMLGEDITGIPAYR